MHRVSNWLHSSERLQSTGGDLPWSPCIPTLLQYSSTLLLAWRALYAGRVVSLLPLRRDGGGCSYFIFLTSEGAWHIAVYDLLPSGGLSR
ncbi:hypothetical protein A0H81_03206 [Grifola frondosa]|uniref:Uncharacterized protein n=1 Tax=Grifola frondosa TaxID=5627 RepID=A0A1C7MK11_GRIFR|nr:hypothetical protein A0H81_03206 [Grifola frondosa]